MTQIKICGITKLEDALATVEEGVEALGFIFYPTSPRYISPVEARKIIRQLPSFVSTIGVFVNASIDSIKEVSQFCGVRFVQLHGDETPEYCREFSPHKIIKVISLNSEEDLEKLSLYSCRAFLADTRTETLYGGTGKQGNLDLIEKASQKYPLILSGGLSVNNISLALKTVFPMAVDINSGVEILPGIKDNFKIRQIVKKIQEYDLGKPFIPQHKIYSIF